MTSPLETLLNVELLELEQSNPCLGMVHVTFFPVSAPVITVALSNLIHTPAIAHIPASVQNRPMCRQSSHQSTCRHHCARISEQPLTSRSQISPRVAGHPVISEDLGPAELTTGVYYTIFCLVQRRPASLLVGDSPGYRTLRAHQSNYTVYTAPKRLSTTSEAYKRNRMCLEFELKKKVCHLLRSAFAATISHHTQFFMSNKKVLLSYIAYVISFCCEEMVSESLANAPKDRPSLTG